MPWQHVQRCRATELPPVSAPGKGQVFGMWSGEGSRSPSLLVTNKATYCVGYSRGSWEVCPHFADQNTGAGVTCQASQWQDSRFQSLWSLVVAQLGELTGKGSEMPESPQGIGIGGQACALTWHVQVCSKYTWHSSRKAHTCTNQQVEKLPECTHTSMYTHSEKI